MQHLQVLDSALSHLKERFDQNELKEVAIVKGVLLGLHTSIGVIDERTDALVPTRTFQELLSLLRVSKKYPLSALKEAGEGFSGLKEDARELLPQVRLLLT